MASPFDGLSTNTAQGTAGDRRERWQQHWAPRSPDSGRRGVLPHQGWRVPVKHHGVEAPPAGPAHLALYQEGNREPAGSGTIYEIKRQLYESLHVHENAASERSLRRAKFLPWRGGLDPLALELTRQAWFMPLSSSGPGPVTDDPQVPLGRAQRDLPSLVAGTLPLS